MVVPIIREVKQLSNVFIVFCILQAVCIALTARVSGNIFSFPNECRFLAQRFFCFTDTLLTALDVGLHLSKYCTDASNWKEVIGGVVVHWTEQGEKHKLCPEVPTIAPGVWTVPLVIACLGPVLIALHCR